MNIYSKFSKVETTAQLPDIYNFQNLNNSLKFKYGIKKYKHYNFRYTIFFFKVDSP